MIMVGGVGTPSNPALLRPEGPLEIINFFVPILPMGKLSLERCCDLPKATE